MNVNFRSAQETDLPFIYSSWLKSYRRAPECKGMNNETFFTRYKKIIQKIMKDSIFIVSCNQDDSDQIFGYMAYKYIEDIFVLHYIYIKYPYRKFGMSLKMLGSVTDLDKPFMVTFANDWTQGMKDKLLLTYDPFIR